MRARALPMWGCLQAAQMGLVVSRCRSIQRETVVSLAAEFFRERENLYLEHGEQF